MPSAVLDDLPSLSELPPEPTDGEPQSVELLFWELIKGSTRIADYEAYLRQYPEGSFVALARTRLGEFASAAGGMRDPNDREVELSFWELVRESDNPASLQAYLEKYPDGEFKSLAEIPPQRAPRAAHILIAPLVRCHAPATRRCGQQSTMIPNPRISCDQFRTPRIRRSLTTMWRCAAATRSRARSRSVTVYRRGFGRMRVLRGPFAALLTRMAALSCLPIAIVPLRLSRDSN